MSNLTIAEQAEVIQAAGPQTRDAQASLDFIRDYKIQTGSDFVGAVRMVAEIKGKWSEVDAKRKQYTSKLAELVDQFNGEFKPGLEALKEAEKTKSLRRGRGWKHCRGRRIDRRGRNL